jgi:hypothetical protein
VRDPIAILAHLIDLFDELCGMPLEDFKHPVEAAVLDLLNGALHDLNY